MKKTTATLSLWLALFVLNAHTYGRPFALRDSAPCFNCKIFIPNAFSPNNDGRNDVFRPETSCELASYELRVFNRWGDEVFASQSPEQGWDGSIKSQPAAAGVYVYIVTYTFGADEPVEGETKTGDLMLVR
jgi:gliding motility-associated-like protein